MYSLFDYYYDYFKAATKKKLTVPPLPFHPLRELKKAHESCA